MLAFGNNIYHRVIQLTLLELFIIRAIILLCRTVHMQMLTEVNMHLKHLIRDFALALAIGHASFWPVLKG